MTTDPIYLNLIHVAILIFMQFSVCAFPNIRGCK